MTIWFLSIVVGVVTLIATQNGFWGLTVGLAAFLLIRWLRPPVSKNPLDFEVSLSRQPAERATPIEVVCKTVTPMRQEWVSLKTGRLYDVLSADGLADAHPGDKGRVILTGSAWRIAPLDSSEAPSSDADTPSEHLN